MNARVAKPPAGTSPRMVFLSAVLHGLGILAIILFSSSFFSKPKPITPEPSRVTIVSPLTAPVTEPITVPETAPKEPEVSQPLLASVPREEKTLDRPRATIDSHKAKPSKLKTIPLKRSERQPKRVPEKSKPEKKPQKPEKQHVASRIEEFKKRHATTEKRPSRTTLSGSNQRPGALKDAESVRWLDDVKNLINANWSVLRENRDLHKETVIGVRITEDGSLTDWSINRPSGDHYLDQSALRAVHQAAPFPPVPQILWNRIRKEGGLALRFSTRGVH